MQISTVQINTKPRLFVDMDGTLAEWRKIRFDMDTEEETSVEKIKEMLDEILYLPGYYRTLSPYTKVTEAVKALIKEKQVEVFVLSCVKEDKGNISPLQDKKDWLDEYLPEVGEDHRIFVPDGENKTDYIPGGLRGTDCLLDDYSKNLQNWENTLDKMEKTTGRAIKLLNDVNESKGTWKGAAVSFTTPADVLAKDITDIIMKSENIRHPSPDKAREDYISNKDFIAYSRLRSDKNHVIIASNTILKNYGIAEQIRKETPEWFSIPGEQETKGYAVYFRDLSGLVSELLDKTDGKESVIPDRLVPDITSFIQEKLQDDKLFKTVTVNLFKENTGKNMDEVPKYLHDIFSGADEPEKTEEEYGDR